jgi:branched-chain amino acid transport system ATP-binding protein
MAPVLEAIEITKSFSGVTALSELSLEIGPGERVGLIGPNGAGKTTLFNCMLGVLRPDRGKVLIDGHDVSSLRVYQRARRGIGRTFQRIELFPDCTVREHLLIAERTRLGHGALWKDLIGLGRSRPEEVRACDEVLELLGLDALADEPIEHLSLGRGRLVEVGRALMTNPKVLLLDEPSSGLDHDETTDLARTLREVQAEHGFAVLLVEHDVAFVSQFTERAYVVDFGQKVAEGPTREVLQDDKVRAAYLGSVAS